MISLRAFFTATTAPMLTPKGKYGINPAILRLTRCQPAPPSLIDCGIRRWPRLN
ncbi:hypothetical protein yberc0001_23950 [Yersinia bercovieri ATCC 43970]|uniref:Uncharacterized protein n=1 Tax=Yersinia bercovieri ATCC 43970 TaxID=349968 RepID=A0ABP2E5T0_YERBE|nr:hypothetical protein yberc0001_23950 [Yersinia bercovieri ATCC 43970]